MISDFTSDLNGDLSGKVGDVITLISKDRSRYFFKLVLPTICTLHSYMEDLCLQELSNRMRVSVYENLQIYKECLKPITIFFCKGKSYSVWSFA